MNASSVIDDQSVAAGGEGTATIAAICAESGWPCNERAGDCFVRLEVHRDAPPFYARVERAADGGISAWVDLTTAARELGGGGDTEDAAASQAPACRRAVQAMFAEVAARMRLVRGRFKESPPGWIAEFEVRMAGDGGGEELAEALSALSVACQLAGPEVQLLLSEPDIVESYLDLALGTGEEL